MSEHVIDVTRRSRVRALAAHMHRAGIANVLSTAGGGVVDETALSDDQRAEAAKILEEVDAGSLSVEDVELASQTAAIIRRYVKPSCAVCRGAGVVRRGSSDGVCGCVDKRYQAKVDSDAFANRLRAPGFASGVRVKSTRTADGEARLAAAKAMLARAQDAVATACADIDSSIKELEEIGAAYFAERQQLDERRAAHAACADNQDQVAGIGKLTADRLQDRVEETAIQIGQALEPLFLGRLPETDDDRVRVHEAVDAIYAATAEACRHRANQKIAEANARHERDEERLCEQQITALDLVNALITTQIQKQRAERARVAGHHQPKIDRAEKRLRRLTYLYGDRDAGALANGEQ